MRLAPIILLTVSLAIGSSVHATVFKCVDADGRITYTNDRSLGRNCTPLDTDQPVSSIPAPTRSATTAPSTPAPAVGSFPRVSPDAQRARDDTRRQILESELATEQAALEEARQALAEEEARDAPEDRNVRRQTADGRSYSSINLEKRAQRLQPYKDEVELHERNIEALRRELRGLR